MDDIAGGRPRWHGTDEYGRTDPSRPLPQAEEQDAPPAPTVSDEDAADITWVAAHNDYPIELWRDETLREHTWALLRDACAETAAQHGRKLIAGNYQYQEQRYWEFARDVEMEGEGTMLLSCDENEADAVRLRLACWTAPA